MTTEPGWNPMTRRAQVDLLPSVFTLSRLRHLEHPDLTRKQFLMVQR